MLNKTFMSVVKLLPSIALCRKITVTQKEKKLMPVYQHRKCYSSKLNSEVDWQSPLSVIHE